MRRRYVHCPRTSGLWCKPSDARQHTQGNQQAEEEANKEAEAEIQRIREAGKKGQEKVINDLLSAVFEAHPTPIS